MLLGDKEQKQAVKDVSHLIVSSGQTASVFRAGCQEKLFSLDDDAFIKITDIPIELGLTPPMQLTDKIDAIASVLAIAEIRSEDRLLIAGETYRVQSVEEKQFFGTITHKVAQLVKLHGR